MCTVYPLPVPEIISLLIILRLKSVGQQNQNEHICHTQIIMQPLAEKGYLCVKAESQHATVFHLTNPFSPLLSRWLVKKKKSMATSNHMCNKWCWLCSCGVTTDGVVIVLPQSACARFRHTLNTAPMGTFSTDHVTTYCQGNYPKDSKSDQK